MHMKMQNSQKRRLEVFSLDRLWWRCWWQPKVWYSILMPFAVKIASKWSDVYMFTCIE